MSDTRLFYIAGGGMLLGGFIAGVLVGPEAIATSSPLVALLVAGAIAGGGAVLLQHLAS